MTYTYILGSYNPLCNKAWKTLRMHKLTLEKKLLTEKFDLYMSTYSKSLTLYIHILSF